MPSARTTLTEIATALGCLDYPNLDWAVIRRPGIDGLRSDDWDQIDTELARPDGRAVAEAAFENGQHFVGHVDGLRGRPPVVLEWTGGRRIPGDQAIPADLRLDHVYLVSCKYLSKIVLNTSPARLFELLLQPGSVHQRNDWFESIAPEEHRAFASAAASDFGVACSWSGGRLDAASRATLKERFGRRARLEGEVAAAYRDLCAAVSSRSAERWRSSLATAGVRGREDLLWRVLRFASATYFVLGAAADRSLRLRVMTPWDWRQRFELSAFEIEAAAAGQPQVRWEATVHDRVAGREVPVHGHVEIRWSHGRFARPPEAKVYLDTPPAEVPGYVPLT